jgi:hypothetical protein
MAGDLAEFDNPASSTHDGRANSQEVYDLDSWGQTYWPLPYAEMSDSINPDCPGNRPPVLHHLVPEVARFIIFHPESYYQAVHYMDDIASLQPAWFVNKASFDWEVFPSTNCASGTNEDTTFPPVYLAWMFQAKAWVSGSFTTGIDALMPYLDGPYNPVGDLDYINRLVTTYEAAGITTWCDVHTSCPP